MMYVFCGFCCVYVCVVCLWFCVIVGDVDCCVCGVGVWWCGCVGCFVVVDYEFFYGFW